MTGFSTTTTISTTITMKASTASKDKFVDTTLPIDSSTFITENMNATTTATATATTTATPATATTTATPATATTTANNIYGYIQFLVI